MIAFNTGRLYTTAGQRIAAELIETGLLFTDIDRGIDGFVPAAKLPEGFTLTQANVTRVYDFQARDWNCMEPFRHAETMVALRTAAKEAK